MNSPPRYALPTVALLACFVNSKPYRNVKHGIGFITGGEIAFVIELCLSPCKKLP